jgi:tetratricopeptide (TPR) repeat protein
MIASPDSLFFQALRAHKAGQIRQAVGLYQTALGCEPSRVDIRVNLANALAVSGQFSDAVAHYESAIALRPDDAEIHNNLGNAFQALRQFEQAQNAYERALRLDPDYADAHYNLGTLQLGRGRPEAASVHLERAMALAPASPNVLRNLASACCAQGRTRKAFDLYERHAKLVYGGPDAAHRGGNSNSIYKHRHDMEQQNYLSGLGIGISPAGFRFYLADGSTLPSPAINNANIARANASWRAANPQILVIDDFLNPEALEKLQRFCWGSTIWQRAYGAGYLGAMAEHGLACPLLAQIADELRRDLDVVIGQHKLKYLWAFKYDSRMSGTEVHADKAVINVNFWITPDEANLDPDGGGLIVWDVAAPLDWEPAKYNGDISACRDFLDRHRAQPVKIPYRCNRAVIFDSDLFHQTDKISFRDDYLSRRMNITMLFGDRDASREAI